MQRVDMVCNECLGGGSVNCDHCKGDGYFLECSHGGNCPCPGHAVGCEECGGVGVLVCDVCGGEGHYEAYPDEEEEDAA